MQTLLLLLSVPVGGTGTGSDDVGLLQTATRFRSNNRLTMQSSLNHNPQLGALLMQSRKLLKDGSEKTPKVVEMAEDTLQKIEAETLPAVRVAHTNDKAILSSAFDRYAMVTSFHNGALSREAQLRAADREASTQHSKCRVDEVPLYKSYTDCETEREALWAQYAVKHTTFKNGGLCEDSFGEDQDLVDEDAYEDLVTNGQKSLAALKAHETKKRECQAKKLTYDNHRATCDGKKVHLEDAVCQSHLLRMESFQEMYEWWDEVDASYRATRVAIASNAQQREQEVRALIEVKCLLTTIHERGGKACADDEDDTVTDKIKACQDADVEEVENVEIIAQEPPTRPAASDSAPHPCSSEFINAEYSGADMEKLPSFPDCQPCTLRNAALTRGAFCAGTTPVGTTEWQVYDGKYIFVDIDTSVCGFTETPKYLSALQGTTSHWTSKGSSEIYSPTETGFRIYIFMVITPAEANARKYAIHWIAGSAEQPVDGACEGQAASWTAYNGNSDMVQTVDTSACAFSDRPVYVTSVEGTSSHWTSSGSSEVYSATANKFTQYIKGSNPSQAASNGYKTNFIGLDPSKSSTGACGGRTSEDDWVTYSANGIYVDVDTSKCGFETTPVYVSSLHGTSSHWSSTGSSELYSPTATGFRIYISTTSGVASAKSWKWQIEWLAAEKTPDRSLCAGTTPPGATDWKVYSGQYIYVDVDTSKCKFADTPRYVTALQGTTSHWTSKGSSEIYSPTPTGFRIYIHMTVTPAAANERKYAIHWVAGSPQQPVPGVCEGQSASWTAYNGNSDMVQTVDTSACAFSDRPVYVTSMQGTSSHWTSTGSSEVYAATANQFTQYIDGSNPSQASSNGYKTNYIAVNSASSSKGSCAGRTSENDWVEYSANGIYVDVDTSKCGFETTPVYVSSLHGTSSHWTSTGSSELYSPTATGFRIYISTTAAIVSGQSYKSWKWQIEWVAVAKV